MTKKLQDKFVPYNLALRLKNIGFDEPCLTYHFIGGKLSKYYKNAHRNRGLIQQKPYKFDCTAILWQDAFDWLHDEHHLLAQISRLAQGSYHATIQSTTDEYLELLRECKSICIDEVVDVYTYKDARLETLTKMINKVEEQKHHAEQQ